MKKYVGLTAAVLFLIVWFSYQFYLAVQRPLWSEQENAIKQALDNTELQLADSVTTYNGENTYHIVYGLDIDNEPVYVWVSEDDTEIVAADEVVSPNQIESAVFSKYNDAQILKIIPGKLDGRLVWEAFYKTRSDNRYYYDYFEIKTGKFVKSYKLGAL